MSNEEKNDQNVSESTPASGGQTEEKSVQEEITTLRQQVEQLEREKTGIYNDLKSERLSRQEAESKIVPQSSAAPETSEVEEDEVDRLLKKKMEKYAKPLTERITKLEKEKKEQKEKIEAEQAYKWVANKENVTAEKIIGSDTEKELVAIIKEYNMHNMHILDGTKAAYDILQQRRRAKQEVEKASETQREEKINATAPGSSSAPAKGGKKLWSSSEIKGMSADEYIKHREEIQSAIAEGRYKQE